MYDGFVVVVTLLEKIGFGESFLSSLNNTKCFAVVFSFVSSAALFCSGTYFVK